MPPVPLHKLFLSYPESFQSVSSYLGVESEEKTFSSHLSEPLLVAEGGSESRTGEWPAGWRSGWGATLKGLAPASWVPALAICNTAHSTSLLSVPGRVFFNQVHFSKTFQE